MKVSFIVLALLGAACLPFAVRANKQVKLVRAQVVCILDFKMFRFKLWTAFCPTIN